MYFQKPLTNEFTNNNANYSEQITNKLASIFLSISQSDLIKNNFNNNTLNNFIFENSVSSNFLKKYADDLNEIKSNSLEKPHVEYDDPFKVIEEENFSEFFSVPEKNLNLDKLSLQIFEKEKILKLFQYSQEYYEMISENNFIAFAIKDDLSDYSISMVNLVKLKCQSVTKDVYLTNFSLIKNLSNTKEKNNNPILNNEKFSDVKIFLVKNSPYRNTNNMDGDNLNKDVFNNKEVRYISYSELINQKKKHEENNSSSSNIINNNKIENTNQTNYNNNINQKKKRYRRTKLEMKMGINLKRTFETQSQNKNIIENNNNDKKTKSNNNIKIDGNINPNKNYYSNSNLVNSIQQNTFINTTANNITNIQNPIESIINNDNNIYNNSETSPNLCNKYQSSNDSINAKNFFDEEMNIEFETNKFYFHDEFLKCVDILEVAENKQFNLILFIKNLKMKFFIYNKLYLICIFLNSNNEIKYFLTTNFQ